VIADVPQPGRLGRGARAAALGTAVSRITGFIRLAAMAYALGVAETRLADAYNLANNTPNIIYEFVLGGVLSAVVLRVYVEVRERDGREEAWRFITRLTNLAMVGLTLIAILGIAASPWIIRAYTFRVPIEAREQLVQVGAILLAMFVPQILFYGLNTIATAVLRADNRFGVFMSAQVFNNLAVATMFAIFARIVPSGDRTLEAVPTQGLVLLGLGTTAGVALLGLIPWLYSRKVGLRYPWRAEFRDPRFSRLARMSAYTIGYVAINQAALLVTLVLAAQIRGAVTARELAFVLFQLPHGLLAVSISIVLGTTLTELAVVGNVTRFGQNLIQGLRAILFVVLPAAAGYLAIAPEIVRFLFERGVVGPQSTGLISFLLRGYAVGLVFFSSWHLIYQAFQGLGDTRTPMLINLGAFAVHAALSITLFGLFGDPRLKVMGLSLAHALSYVVASAAGFRILQRRVGVLEARPLAVTVAKAGAAAVAAGTAAWLIARGSEIALDVSSFSAQAFQILGATLGGLLLYAALAKILRLEELGWLRNIIVGRAL